MLTKLYLDTTNPNLKFSQLFQPNIFIPMLISIVFHTVIYILFFNMASYIFFGKTLSKLVNTRLLYFLLPIMFFGFIGRFYHVKEIYRAYNGDMNKTRNHLDRLYISWIFVS